MGGALRFLTILPVPGRHRAPGAAELLAFPLVGALVGGVWVAVLAADGLVPVPVLAALVLVADALLTGGLHLDALADVADGVASRRRGDAAIAVMRDPDVGAGGALALVLVCLLRWSALLGFGGLARGGEALALLAAPVAGRLAMVLLLALLPPRADGSLAAALTRPRGAVVAGAAGIAAFVCVLAGRGGLGAGAPAALLAGAVTAPAWAAWWRRRFGDLNGDGVGAAGLLAETVALLVLSGVAARS